MSLNNLRNIIDNLKSLDIEAQTQLVVEQNVSEITILQKRQLYEGRGSNNEYIRPLYSENPYFKKPGAALRYAQYKQKITPDARRPLDVPNLFVDGTFYDTLAARISGKIFEIEPNSAKGKDIFRVHSNAEGLDDESRLDFINSFTIPTITKYLETKGIFVK